MSVARAYARSERRLARSRLRRRGRRARRRASRSCTRCCCAPRATSSAGAARALARRARSSTTSRCRPPTTRWWPCSPSSTRFRGASRFTTWAYKFALLEAGVKARRRAWQGREIPLDRRRWAAFADRGPAPTSSGARPASCSRAMRAPSTTQLTDHQREVFVALALQRGADRRPRGAARTTRGALYKTLHDARRKLRAALADHDLGADIMTRSAARARAAARSRPGPSSAARSASSGSTSTSSSSCRARRRRASRAWPPTSTAARPAARTTRACAPSSAAGRRDLGRRSQRDLRIAWALEHRADHRRAPRHDARASLESGIAGATSAHRSARGAGRALDNVVARSPPCARDVEFTRRPS